MRRSEIVHFWQQTLTDGAPQAEILRPGPKAEALAPSTHRVFLIELDRLTERVHPPLFEDVRGFLQQRLLRQDYAAIAAFGRVTDFTTDHAALAEVVSRLEMLNQTIRRPSALHLLRDLWSASPPVGSEAATLLDGIFAPASTGQQLALRNRAGFEELLDAAERRFRDRAKNDFALKHRRVECSRGCRVWHRHLTKVLGDIQMLRHLDGDKHLIWAGAILGKDDSAAVAGIASHARVAVYGIQAYGLSIFRKSGPGRLLGERAGGDHGRQILPQLVGEGGAGPDRHPHADELSAGYIPSAKDEADGTKHNIVVRVKGRPDATIYARRQYVAGPTQADADLTAVLMKERVNSTAWHPREAVDIRVKATATAKDKVIAIDVSIDANQLAFTEDAGRHRGKIEVAAFATDQRERLIGEDWRTVTLNLQPETWPKHARTD